MTRTGQQRALVGAKIFDGDVIKEGFAVILDGETIRSVLPEGTVPAGCPIVTLNGGLLTPGFIDVQVNGGGGLLFNNSPTIETIGVIAKAHRQFGTTGFLPTLISDSFDTMRLACDAVQLALQENTPGVLGVHLEGPFLNKKRKGVHDADFIRAFETEIFQLMPEDNLGKNILTLAPETLPSGTVRRLIEQGLKVCAGHTAGTYEELGAALDEGLSGFTHLFNAMTPMESRAPGVVGAALEDDESYCGIIADGFHIHPATLKVAIAAKKRGRMMLVTDAMPSVGSHHKAFKIYGQEIIVDGGRCTTRDGVLAGSDLDMIGAVRNCVNLLDLPLEEALRMASLYPATFLQLDEELGRIGSSYRADLVHLSNDLVVQETWIRGESEKHGL